MLWKMCHPLVLASFLLSLTLFFFPFISSSCSPYLLIYPPLSFPPHSLHAPFFTSTPLLSSSFHPSALISLAPITSLLHFLLLLLQRLVVLVNNWFWLSQCADKDNSRAIKSSSPVLSSCFFPPLTLQTHTHTHTHIHTVSCLSPSVFSLHSASLPSSSPPPRRLSVCSGEVDFSLSFSFSSLPPSLVLLPLAALFVVVTHSSLIQVTLYLICTLVHYKKMIL